MPAGVGSQRQFGEKVGRKGAGGATRLGWASSHCGDLGWVRPEPLEGLEQGWTGADSGWGRPPLAPLQRTGCTARAEAASEALATSGCETLRPWVWKVEARVVRAGRCWMGGLGVREASETVPRCLGRAGQKCLGRGRGGVAFLIFCVCLVF